MEAVGARPAPGGRHAAAPTRLSLVFRSVDRLVG